MPVRAARMVLLSIAMTLRPAMVPVRVQNQGSHMSVEIHGGQVLEHPPDGRLRRKILSHLKAHGLQVGGGQVGDVLPYRCQTPATGQHPRHGHRDSTVSRLWRTPRLSRGSVMFLKNLGQGLARQGGRRGR